MKNGTNKKSSGGTKASSRILALILAVLMVAGAATYTIVMLMSAFA